MMKLNDIKMIGYVCSEVESKPISESLTIAEFSLATDNGYFNKQNEWVEKPLYIEIKCQNKLAEKVQTKFLRGDEVYVSGSLEMDSWEDKETGAKRSKFYLRAFNAQIVKSKADRETLKGNTPHTLEPTDDDIPF